MRWRCLRGLVADGAELKPKLIQIYSTDYPVPDATVQRVPAFRLRELAEIARHRTGAQVRAFWPE